MNKCACDFALGALMQLGKIFSMRSQGIVTGPFAPGPSYCLHCLPTDVMTRHPSVEFEKILYSSFFLVVFQRRQQVKPEYKGVSKIHPTEETNKTYLHRHTDTALHTDHTLTPLS